MGLPIALRQLPVTLRSDGRSLQIAIYESLRTAIQQGRLRPGSRLPATRDFARQLGVARGTVVDAYDQLAAEGYLSAARGAGTRVAGTLPEKWLAPRRAPASGKRFVRGISLSRRGERLMRSPFPTGVLPAPRPFRPHTPAVDAFPLDLWGRLVARHARNSRPDRLRDGDARGYPPLREALAEHLRVYRGVDCSADRLVIASGTQQILDLAARLLLDEGDAAWMEDPGHFGAREVLRAAGARLVPVPVDASGMNVASGLSVAPEARLAYVTPARQSPLGSVLSLERRARLLEWARARSAWIFEDDYDSEFRYQGRPLPALQGLDRYGTVIYSGTLSKTMFPGLRVAFAVLPDALVDPFASALSLLARYVPLLPQLALSDFIAEGHFARHLRRMRLLYAERREALLEALRSELGDDVEIVGSSAGLEVVAYLPPSVNDRAVAKLALPLGVELLPLSRYCIRPPARGGLVLGFAAVSAARSRKAAPLLRMAIDQARSR
ncbi:MAG TPA: PLP-dependent aminotransferase family protein [Gemmatimonadales bacterium]|nr:PLP-dependent aminotransferase family protein [Gemmatimonadales bacterium]